MLRFAVVVHDNVSSTSVYFTCNMSKSLWMEWLNMNVMTKCNNKSGADSRKPFLAEVKNIKPLSSA